MTETDTEEPFANDGSISTEYTFWCGLCARWEQLPSEGSKKRTAKAARRKGWSLTKEHGWTCNKHREKK